MSRYHEKPLSFDALKTVPINAREAKVRLEHFGAPYANDAIAGLLNSLPKILAADSFRAIIAAIRRARDRKRALLWGMGGHVIKCGLADILLDLQKRGWVS